MPTEQSFWGPGKTQVINITDAANGSQGLNYNILLGSTQTTGATGAGLSQAGTQSTIQDGIYTSDAFTGFTTPGASMLDDGFLATQGMVYQHNEGNNQLTPLFALPTGMTYTGLEAHTINGNEHLSFAGIQDGTGDSIVTEYSWNGTSASLLGSDNLTQTHGLEGIRGLASSITENPLGHQDLTIYALVDANQGDFGPKDAQYTDSQVVTLTQIPEPSTLLLGLAAAGIGALYRNRK